MVLTAKQEEALKIAIKRYKNKEPYTCIAGYAGAGKSTLVQFIIAALELNPKYDVCYVTYTGKASIVLKEKGCPNAQTAHRLLYQSYPRSDGSFYHKPRRPIEPYKLIIVDEVSMIPKDMWELLLSHHIHVIALGDPGQLPALTEQNGVLDKPHIFLDEIMRQAQDSEIIRLTMDIRAGKPLKYFKGEEVQVLPAIEEVDGLYTWADQIIVATNANRKYVNHFMRKTLLNTEDPLPIDGDRIICLRNDWDNISAANDVTVNGSTGIISNIKYDNSNPFFPNSMKADFLLDCYTDEDVDNSPVDLYFRNIPMDYKLFNEGEPSINKDNFRKIPKGWHPKEFDYAYAITCWKAQGSEYGKVLVFEEGFPWDKETHIKYLYTAATRAIDKLVILKKS